MVSSPPTTISAPENALPTVRVPNKLGYVPELDGVRGLAILFVLGNHIPLGRLSSLLPGGFAGVDIFFVLSGFLITTLLVQEFDATGSINLRNFYTRRALRLGPALLAMLTVLCVFSFLLYDKSRAQGNCRDAFIALFYASNWVRVFSKNQLGLLAHTWSLSTEEQFYLLWPLILLALLKLTPRRHYVVIVAAGVTLLSWLVNLYLAIHLPSTPRLMLDLCFRLDSRAGTLMIGCILGVVLSSGMLSEHANATIQKWLKVIAPLSLAVLVAFSILSYLVGHQFFYCGFGVLALLAAALIGDVMVSPRSMVKRVFAMKWLVWMGSISYGLYLWHWPILYGMHQFGFKGWTVVLVGLPLTFLFVVPSYYFMERPILDRRRRS